MITNPVTTTMSLSPHVRRVGYYLVPTVTLLSRHARLRKQAVAQKLSKGARNRLEWIIWYETGGERNTSLTARHFGIVRKTLYHWLGRFDETHLTTLEETSRAPKHVREREITLQEEECTVALRRAHMRWGKVKLAKVYETVYDTTVSSWKVQYTIKKYNLYPNPARNKKIQAKRTRRKTKKRTKDLKKQPFPEFLIALDTIVLYWNGKQRYVLTAIDTVSKIAFARMYTTKHSRNAKDFIERMVYLLDYDLGTPATTTAVSLRKSIKKPLWLWASVTTGLVRSLPKTTQLTNDSTAPSMESLLPTAI